MIREVGSTQLDSIDSIMSRFIEQTPGTPQDFVQRVKDAITNDRACFYGYYDDDSLIGVALFGKVSKRISFSFADGNLKLEKELVSFLFDRHSPEYSYIITGGAWISDAMSQHIMDLGFMAYRRAHMSLSRAGVESLQDPSLPEGLKFEVYTTEMKDEVADLMFKCNDGHVDQDVFPDFFGSLEGCRRFIDNIEESRFGEYKKKSSWVLIIDGTTIGFCFMTLQNSNIGIIPDIAINPSYRRRGLGRAILVHSMKRQAESEETLTKVDLDVTLSNPARFMYASLGFETDREYTMYTWKK